MKVGDGEWSYNNAPDGGASITKSTDSYLFASGFGATTTADAFDMWKSTNSGDNWSLITPARSGNYAFLDDDTDHAQLVPLSGGDVMVIYHDSSATDLYSFVYDEGTDSWDAAPTTIESDYLDSGSPACTSSGSTCGDFGATVYRSTGDIYLAYPNDKMGAGGDLKAAKFSDSGRTWSSLTDIYTDIGTDGEEVKMALNDNNGDLYAVYLYGADGSRTVYAKKSTDGGSTWGTAYQVSSATTRDYTTVHTNIIGTEHIYAIGLVEDNTVFGYSVALFATPTPTPTPTPITTASEWAIMALAGVFASLLVWKVVHRKARVHDAAP